ncbi:MAG TPA: Trm112 family protein [Candidatus Eisenbacteria bacterium]|nr:Trm112 family protein [Candidatus Eisenbacteria bacterium]
MPEKDREPTRPAAAAAEGAGAPISDQLLAILVCPQCRQDLEYDRGAGTFTCHHCRLRFSIVDGVPNFLIEEAERI